MIRDIARRASRRQRVVMILLLSGLLYGALGYLALSPWLRSTLVNTLATQTGRPVALDKVVFNPFALSLSLRGFSLKDEDGGDFFAFDEFYINFQLSSLLRRSWYFDSIVLLAPRGRLVRQDDGTLNVTDLLAALPTDEPSEPAAPTRLPRLSFRALSVVAGDFRYRDEARTEPEELVLTPLTFQVSDFSTHADDDGNNQFAFAVSGSQGGKLDWQGTLAFEPLRASGRVALKGVSLVPFADFFQHFLNFTVPQAQLDIASDYQLETDGDGVLRLQQGELVLSNVAIHDPSVAEPIVSLSRLRLGDIRLDSASHDLLIGKLDVDGLNATVKWQQEGLQLANLLKPRLLTPRRVADSAPQSAPQPMAEASATEQSAARPVATPAWRLQLQQLAVNGANITIIDETLAAPGLLLLSPVNLRVNNVVLAQEETSEETTGQPSSDSSSPDNPSPDEQPFSFSGDMGIGERGKLVVSGEGSLAPLAVTVNMEGSDIALSAFQRWLQNQAALALRSGQLATTLTVGVRTEDDGGASVDVAGAATVTDLDLVESDGSALVSWQQLALSGLALSPANRQLTVASIELDQPRLRWLVDAEGRDPTSRILSVADPITEPSVPASAPAAPWHIRLGRLRWQAGQLQHRDRSLASAFQVSLNGLRGELSDLDSRRPESGQLSLQASINDLSPLSVSGTFNPLADTPNMALQIGVQGYDMAGLTPYTGIFLGHTVASGQLEVQADMALDGTLLDSNTLIKANNFFLGDQVSSDQAVRAPIKLGLAVLRDRSGMIRLPIKASGDLSDPSVSISGIILRTISNVMVKAATSPFSALASLVGGKEINQIVFQSGGIELTAAGRQQLADIAAVLNDRPALLLELSGAVTADDRVQLAQQALGEELTDNDWPGLQPALSRGSFRRAVQRQYQQQFSVSAETLLGDQVIADDAAREKLVSERAFIALAEQRSATFPDNGVVELADLRAQRGKMLLVEQFAVAAERLSIVSATREAPVAGVLLGLSAR